MKVLITGATGLIGKELGKKLVERHELFVISRDRAKALRELPYPAAIIEGDLSQGPIHDPRLREVEAVIHLAGESVASGRWSEDRKKEIYDSRVSGTRHLQLSLPSSLQVIVSASAAGFYGDGGETELTEESPAGADFLAQVCRDWEGAVREFSCRQVILRTGIVLSARGGALDKMMFPFRAGVGGSVGRGRQWLSWIDLDDLVRMYIWALENEKVRGVYNAVAPTPVTNQFFSRALAKALGRPLGPPVPPVILKIIFGEFAEAMTSSQKISSQKSSREGFCFQHGLLEKQLNFFTASFRGGEEIFVSEQFIPLSPEEVFSYFRKAHNLEKLTPDFLHFHIVSVSTPQLREGTQIEYKLKLHGFPFSGVTRIQQWQPPQNFVDSQCKGPYRLWHHTHEFKTFAGGTLLVDRIRYRLPLGYIGWLAGYFRVRKDIENIFLHRRKYLSENIKALVADSL